MNTDEWFVDASKLPQPLNKEETKKLIELASNGSEEARDKLITHNIRLVLYEVSNKFSKVEYDKKDLVSIGNLGLIKAINTYDLSKGFEFATYAARCIDNEILMFLRKLKKDQNNDSFDRVVFEDKDGSKITLEDRLIDDSDFVEDYEKRETYIVIRKLVSELPSRDKEIIMMHFGFYDNHIYTQEEISNKLNISRSYVSRLITKNVKKLGNKLEEQGVVSLHTKAKEKRKLEEKVEEHSELSVHIKNNEIRKKAAKKMKKLQSIYEYFYKYSKQEIDEMISKLTDEERALITTRYGEDLENPVSKKLTKEEINKFYQSLVPKMKRLLANPSGEKKRKPRTPRNSKNNIVGSEPNAHIVEESEQLDQFVPVASENVPQTIVEEIVKEKEEEKISIPAQGDDVPSSAPVVKSTEEDNSITKEDCIKMLELLRTPSFGQMMNMLTAKEAIIISLKLGYVDGKYFSTESISAFLGIEQAEVIDTIKKVLLLYKESINTFLDNAIAIATDKSDQAKTLSFKPTK